MIKPFHPPSTGSEWLHDRMYSKRRVTVTNSTTGPALSPLDSAQV